jgi:cytoplasmic iron level regulating protein YaaA (DUF328/UPF0246 family)
MKDKDSQLIAEAYTKIVGEDGAYDNSMKEVYIVKAHVEDGWGGKFKIIGAYSTAAKAEAVKAGIDEEYDYDDVTVDALTVDA